MYFPSAKLTQNALGLLLEEVAHHAMLDESTKKHHRVIGGVLLREAMLFNALVVILGFVVDVR